MTAEEKWGTNESYELQKRDKMMKRAVCHQHAWVGCTGNKREGKKEQDLASHFVDRLNKSIKAHWSTLIELHKWVWGVGVCTWWSSYKVATGVGRPQLQALSEINHPCRSLLGVQPLIHPLVFLVLSFNSFLSFLKYQQSFVEQKTHLP